MQKSRPYHHKMNHNHTTYKKPMIAASKDSLFFKKIVIQGLICLILLACIISLPFLPFEPFYRIGDNVKFVLADNIDFKILYNNSIDFFKTNFTQDKLTQYEQNITAFFAGEKPEPKEPPILNTTLIKPVAGEIIKPYDKSTESVSFTTAKSEGVVAALEGNVKEIGYNDSEDNYITLTHADSTETVYTHLSEILVKTGDTVTKGMIIGNSLGDENKPFTFKLKKDDVFLDPTPYFPNESNIT